MGVFDMVAGAVGFVRSQVEARQGVFHTSVQEYGASATYHGPSVTARVSLLDGIAHDPVTYFDDGRLVGKEAKPRVWRARVRLSGKNLNLGEPDSQGRVDGGDLRDLAHRAYCKTLQELTLPEPRQRGFEEKVIRLLIRLVDLNWSGPELSQALDHLESLRLLETKEGTLSLKECRERQPVTLLPEKVLPAEYTLGRKLLSRSGIEFRLAQTENSVNRGMEQASLDVNWLFSVRTFSKIRIPLAAVGQGWVTIDLSAPAVTVTKGGQTGTLPIVNVEAHCRSSRGETKRYEAYYLALVGENETLYLRDREKFYYEQLPDRSVDHVGVRKKVLKAYLALRSRLQKATT